MNGEIILSFRTIGRQLNCMIMTLCVFVYVSIREHISRTTRPIFNKFFAKFLRDTYGRGSVPFWLCCDTLCTSGFMDYVMFADNSRE